MMIEEMINRDHLDDNPFVLLPVSHHLDDTKTGAYSPPLDLVLV